MKQLVCGLCIFFAALPAHGLDREAFTFTKYDLKIRVEPEQQRLGVRGKITLRNDSGSSQRSVTLQISSTLNWSSITLAGKPVEFLTQPYISDIDHTGALSEAIVVLPQAIAPKGSVELDVGYEGVIPLDTTRLTRMGVPGETAKHSDWDQISRSFTAVRGIGYVVWYPIATEAASLANGDAEEQTVGRWKLKEANCEMTVNFESTSSMPIFFSGARIPTTTASSGGAAKSADSFSLTRPGFSVPTFVSAEYQKLSNEKAHLEIDYLAGQEQGAREYLDIGSQPDVGVQFRKDSPALQILDLPDAEAAPFATEGIFLTPLKSSLNNDAILNLVYAWARASAPSARAWIQEGLPRYAQAAFVESLQSREAAIKYMGEQLPALIESERAPGSTQAQDSAPLIDEAGESKIAAKAMYIWWMLHDVAGQGALQNAISEYKEADDTSASYVQKLIEAQSHRDLQWFFDDWVYHDRGLPDFRVASVFPSQLPSGGYMVTVTVENLGKAGAEVPVIVHMQSGDVSKKLIVHGTSKASIRIEAPSFPQSVSVNDGSVPETNMSNNELKMAQPLNP